MEQINENYRTDPFTGNSFLPRRKNQSFEFPKNKSNYHNNKAKMAKHAKLLDNLEIKPEIPKEIPVANIESRNPKNISVWVWAITGTAVVMTLIYVYYNKDKIFKPKKNKKEQEDQIVS